MQVAALGMRVANGDARTDHDVCGTRGSPPWEKEETRENQLDSPR